MLYDNGLIDCNLQSNLTLHINSRVGWFGCWLILNNELKTDRKAIDRQNRTFNLKKSKPIKHFIFKDSLSEEDYARLSRIVLSNQH